MKVADLQDMLAVIGQLLASAGGKGAAELDDFRAALEPFRELTAKQLTNELRKLTEKPKPAGKRAKLSVADVDAHIDEVSRLYDRAGTGTTTVEIEEKTRPLYSFGKSDAVRAAEAVGLAGMKSKTITAIADEIRKRISERMGTAQRMGMIKV